MVAVAPGLNGDFPVALVGDRLIHSYPDLSLLSISHKTTAERSVTKGQQ